MGHQHCLGSHHHFHLFETVAYQRGTGTHNVKDGVGKPNPRGDLHRAVDYMDFRGYAFLFKPGGKDLRIRGGDLLTREPRYPGIVDLFGNRQGESALAESQPFYDGYVLPPFEDLVLPTMPASAAPQATVWGMSSSRR